MGAPTPVGNGEGAVVSTCMRTNAHQVLVGAPAPNVGLSGGARHRYAPSWASHRYAPSWANHRYAPSWASQPDPLRSGSARRAPCRALACLPSPRQCPAERDGNQWQSVAISDHRLRLSARQSVAITCGARREKGTTVRNQWQSVAISGHHLRSEAGKGDDRPRERWLLEHLWGEVRAPW